MISWKFNNTFLFSIFILNERDWGFYKNLIEFFIWYKLVLTNISTQLRNEKIVPYIFMQSNSKKMLSHRNVVWPIIQFII